LSSIPTFYPPPAILGGMILGDGDSRARLIALAVTVAFAAVAAVYALVAWLGR
jgi:hypothetical protein